jgi:hypothetical protein
MSKLSVPSTLHGAEAWLRRQLDGLAKEPGR